MLRTLITLATLRKLGRGRTLPPPLAPGAPPPSETVSVVIPARDEAERIGACLAPLQDDPHVHEVLVVDDESADGTADVARAHGARVVAGRPLPDGWAGKAWALQQGLEAATGDWVVFLDADVRPGSGAIAALVERAASVDVLSASPRFICDTDAERWLHAAFLATLVWRFGPSTDAQPRPSRAVFNGQCVVARRAPFARAGGWAHSAVRGALVEDLALARTWRRAGRTIAFVDGADLIGVRMYGSAGETWRGWSRSLMGADATPKPALALDLLTLWVTLALPPLRLLTRRADRTDKVLLAARWAILPALARSYDRRGPGFWLSPLADPLTVARLTWSVLRPDRGWRGRTYAARTARR